MQWFLNLTTKSKLLVSTGILILLLISVIFISYTSMTAIQESQKTLYEKDFTVALDLVELRADLNRQRAKMLEMLISTKRSEQEKLEQDIKNRISQIDETTQKIFDEIQNEPNLIAKMTEMKTILNSFRQTREAQISLIYEGKIDEAKQLVSNIQEERFEKIRAILLELAKDKKDKAKLAVSLSEEKLNSTVKILISIGVASVFIASLIVLLLNHIIANPLKAVSLIAEHLASKDLTVKIDKINRLDEVGTLTSTVSTMIDSLKQLTLEITESTNILASAATEILATITQTASSTAETASAITQTSSTIEEVKQTSGLTAQKAKYVSENAQKVVQVSIDGKKAVSQSIEGMHHIQEQMNNIVRSIVKLSEQSQAIGEIITTVNDLAEQSNLLAVNAAIEAAKAGEQGRGFAVVAQEVKSLAEQSKQATTQVRSILSDIQKATSAAVMSTEQGSRVVEMGLKQSADAGEAIKALTENITAASQAAMQIATSSQQQSIGMDQIALAMGNIKQASSQNLAATKQTEIAAKNLHELGQKLKQLTNQYKV